MPFTYQRLDVYRIAKEFVVFRSDIIKRAKRKIAAIDHLQRAGESVVLNIVHSTETWSAKERLNYLGYANGSALECAACMDVLGVRGICGGDEVMQGKGMLRSVVNMLHGMRDVTGKRLKEEPAIYGNDQQFYFGHEKLLVYQKSLAFMAELDDMLDHSQSSSDLSAKIDKSSTSIILNIAEGNGRFGSAEKTKFFSTSQRALVQTAALIDLIEGLPEAKHSHAMDQLDEIRRLLNGLQS